MGKLPHESGVNCPWAIDFRGFSWAFGNNCISLLALILNLKTMNWKKLQNGSDIRGVALEGLEGEPVNLTNDVVETLAQSFVCWLRSTLGAKVRR